MQTNILTGEPIVPESHPLLEENFSVNDGWKDIFDTLGELHWQNEPEEVIDHTKTVLTTEEQKCELVGMGAGRCVYSLPPDAHTGDKSYVIKFAKAIENDRHLNGRAQNQTEHHFWKEHAGPLAPDESMNDPKVVVELNRQYSAALPIVDIGDSGLWLIMVEGTSVRSLPSDQRPPTEDLDKLFNRIYGELNRDIDESEVKDMNVVIVNGNLYFCDYGYERPH